MSVTEVTCVISVQASALEVAGVRWKTAQRTAKQHACPRTSPDRSATSYGVM